MTSNGPAAGNGTIKVSGGVGESCADAAAAGARRAQTAATILIRGMSIRLFHFRRYMSAGNAVPPLPAIAGEEDPPSSPPHQSHFTRIESRAIVPTRHSAALTRALQRVLAQPRWRGNIRQAGRKADPRRGYSLRRT